MNLYLRALLYVKPYLFRAMCAGVCTIIAAGGTAYLPWVIKDMVDQVLRDKNTEMLNYIALSIVVIFVIRGIAFYGQSYLMSYVGQRVIIDIRRAVFTKLQRLSISFYDKNKTGTIMSYVTNDVSALQGALVDNVVEMITESVILIASIVMMIYLDWKLFLVTFGTFPFVLGFIDIFGKRIRKSGSRIQEAAADITSVLQETVSSARVIKSFVRENYEVARFDKENMNNFRANMKNAQLMATLTPTIEFVAAIGVTIILWYGGNSVINGEITAGSLVAFLTYAVNISNPIKRLSRVIGNIQKALAAAQRVFDVLDLPETVKNAADAKQLPPAKGEVSFKNVSFSYNPGEQVIANVSFDVKPGEMIAFVGPSGAGKSTVASLLPRFYDVDKGSITIDGTDVRDATLYDLRSLMGNVNQEAILFNDTFFNNISFGVEGATLEQVQEAARIANAHDFIMASEDGDDTNIGDRGGKLSGGQRQRISIARAILKNPPILILDEATSALDTESERLVQEALENLMRNRTTIVIAHRLSTIRNADEICVMHEGEIVERGRHEELIGLDGYYKRLCDMQSF